ncbi:cobalamin biosynthesis protein [Actinoplanes hulinensis]|uniref:Cobalamin biosynthesis protein n=1 Tax=Actinoplanes hulinensis TaxID=1144547 RepID=A0ABS7B3H9_9ACTN|nr:cobalamin biosynthesis protein [Actinoplanes hulinensis]MBW6435555.1 cobalamin biosynthesis protein [Actinoplanes hulinensis]
MTLVVGFGARAGVTAGDLSDAVRGVLAGEGLACCPVAVLATLDRRAAEDGPREFAAAAGWRLAGFPASELAAQPVPTPSAAVGTAVGTPSVAEAAALRAAGPGGRLIVPKRVRSGVTVAVARPAGSSRLAVSAVSTAVRQH